MFGVCTQLMETWWSYLTHDDFWQRSRTDQSLTQDEVKMEILYVNAAKGQSTRKCYCNLDLPSGPAILLPSSHDRSIVSTTVSSTFQAAQVIAFYCTALAFKALRTPSGDMPRYPDHLPSCCVRSLSSTSASPSRDPSTN